MFYSPTNEILDDLNNTFLF